MKPITKQNFIQLLAAVYVLVICQTTWGNVCFDIFAVQKKSVITSPMVWLRENLPALVSRVRPTFSNKSFDVRILSTNTDENSFSPQALNKTVVREAQEVQKTLQRLGFSFRSFIQILVEAHPGAIGYPQIDHKNKVTWDSPGRDKTPVSWIGDPNIGIPGIFGVRNRFTGLTQNRGFEMAPTALGLVAISDTQHSVFNPAILAHELSHETENAKSHRSLLWREARADLLTYFTTGQNEIIYPEELTFDLVDTNGVFYEETRNILRSMSNPHFSSLEDIRPHVALYHTNSEIISSLLFAVAQKLGEEKLIHFIHWMDQIEDERVLPVLTLGQRKPYEEPDTFTLYFSEANTNEMKSAIENEIKSIGRLLRQWSTELPLNVSEQDRIENLLLERGI